MEDLTLNEITKRVIDAIEEEPVFNRRTLFPKVLSILKIWMNQRSRPAADRKSLSKYQKVVYAHQKIKIENKFWRDKIRLLSIKPMETYYDELDQILMECGYEKEVVASREVKLNKSKIQ